MKKTLAKAFIIRAISVFSLIVLVVLQIVSGGGFGIRCLLADFIICSSVLMIYPLSYEDAGKSIPFASGLTALGAVLSLCPFFYGNECLLGMLVSLTVTVLYAIYRACCKYDNVRTLFRLDSVWCAVEDYSRASYQLLLCLIGVSALTACRYEAPAWVFIFHLILLKAFYGAQYYRAYTGRTLFIGSRRENSIKEIMRGNLRSMPDSAGTDEQLNAVYSKVIKYMETKKPYLVDGFSIDDLASAVFTNKVYLSKAINYFSGRNYRQFINYYRISYATELMRKDRNIKIVELAMTCGFHSVVTFNMAFKLYMNMTPTAYYGVLATKDVLPSNSQGHGRLAPSLSF